MADKDNILLDHIWSMFNNLCDTNDPELVEACLYLASKYDFDIEVLGETLYDAVVTEIRKDAEESYCDGGETE